MSVMFSQEFTEKLLRPTEKYKKLSSRQALVMVYYYFNCTSLCREEFELFRY